MADNVMALVKKKGAQQKLREEGSSRQEACGRSRREAEASARQAQIQTKPS